MSVTALRTLLQAFPGDSNSPVFVIPRQKKWVPLTDSVARKHLKDICKALGLQNSLTLNDFRRAGSSWGIHQGVPLEHIMKHGTWKSDSVWTYLSSSVSTTSLVLLGFGCFFIARSCIHTESKNSHTNVNIKILLLRNLSAFSLHCLAWLDLALTCWSLVTWI